MQGPGGGERPAGTQRGGGVLAGHVLHVDPELTVGFAAVVDRHDVVVVQAGCQIGLALEALAVAVVGRRGHGKQLERVEPGEPGMVDEIDLAHAAAADQPIDAKPRDDLTGLVHRHRPRTLTHSRRLPVAAGPSALA